MEIVSCRKACGGVLVKCQHVSHTLGGLTASFQIYLPSSFGSLSYPKGRVMLDASHTGDRRVACVYYLAGLTCNEETGVVKTGGFQTASDLDIALVFPDTSPRGAKIEGEDASWDLGTGAGFYIDATQPHWASHYRMRSYIVDELPVLVQEVFPVCPQRRSIMGHSMGGHGALTIGMKHSTFYRSISAFSPICHPVESNWGVKAFKNYLKSEEEWKSHDAVELLASGVRCPPTLVDQGSEDEYFKELKFQDLMEASLTFSAPITLRLQPGYDHSYFFVSSFFSEHLKFHAAHLKLVD